MVQEAVVSGLHSVQPIALWMTWQNIISTFRIRVIFAAMDSEKDANPTFMRHAIWRYIRWFPESVIADCDAESNCIRKKIKIRLRRIRQIWYGFFLGSGAVRIAPAVRRHAEAVRRPDSSPWPAPSKAASGRGGTEGSEGESVNREPAKTGNHLIESGT